MSENTNKPPRSSRPKRRRRRNNYNKNKGGPRRASNNPQEIGPEKLSKRYMTLVENLQNQRKKYYDEFHHHDPNRVAKLRRNFEKASRELFDFDQKLSPEQKTSILNENRIDKTYSELNQLSELGDQVPTDLEPLDPHSLPTQKNSDFKADTEESVGTMDDYRSYKGD